MPEDEDDDGIVPCPVCEQFTFEEGLTAQGMVVGGVKALLEGDTETAALSYGALSAFDGHTAISMLADLILDLSLLTGSHPLNWVNTMREGLNNALASD